MDLLAHFRDIAHIRAAQIERTEAAAYEARREATAREHRKLRLTWVSFAVVLTALALFTAGCIQAPQDVRGEPLRHVRPRVDRSHFCVTYVWLCPAPEQAI